MPNELSPTLPLAVSMGDPAGVGPDLIVRCWAERRRLSLPHFVAFADPNVLMARAALLDIPLAVEVSEHGDVVEPSNRHALPVVAVPLDVPCSVGKSKEANASAIIDSIKQAVESIARNRTSAIVTAPIAKATLTATGFKHQGHTDYLGELASKYWPGAARRPIMMLAGGGLRVVPLTVHIALADVFGQITAGNIIATAEIVAASLQDDFAIAQPRIAITGLNPHAGESGTLGREEVTVIGPAIEQLRARGMAVTGPHPADTLFHAEARSRYDVVIAMYHDQALIPLKTIAFDTGVNITLGLPFVRTSPDHGTAFDVAGSHSVRIDSFVEALRLADEMARGRQRAR